MARYDAQVSTQPLQFLLLCFAGWVNRRQADIIAYLMEENRALRDKLGDKPSGSARIGAGDSR